MPHAHPGRRFPEELAGNLHNILCKLISASDNDLGIAWSAEAAVTTLSDHILNYVSLYRKVLQKHTDMKSVCSSPTAKHLTSFPVAVVTAALGPGKPRHLGPRAASPLPGAPAPPSLGPGGPAQGESTQGCSRGTYRPHLPGVPTALAPGKEALASHPPQARPHTGDPRAQGARLRGITGKTQA